MSVRNKTTRELEILAEDINADIRSRRLSSYDERLAIKDLDIIIEELNYRAEEANRNNRNNNNNTGGSYFTSVNKQSNGVENYFNKTSQNTMSADTVFGSTRLNKGIIPEPTEPIKQTFHSNNTIREPEVTIKTFYSPKYPFITSPNVTEVIEEIKGGTLDNPILIKKRVFTGIDDVREYVRVEQDTFEYNPLYNNEHVNETVFVCDIPNPKISNSVLSDNNDLNTEIINAFIFNEINYDMTNIFQAIDYYIKLKDLSCIKNFLKFKDFKAEYLQHINKIYKSFKVDMKEDHAELILNKKRIYVDIPDLVIPDSDKLFVSEVSNETLYGIIMSVSIDYKSYTGIIEGIDYRFQYFIGYNKILLVRA